jgi:putative cardiolipin synthase
MRRLTLILCLAWLALLGACAGVPQRGEPARSVALLPTETAATALGQIAATSLPAGAPSGFRLLPAGEFALDARLALIRRAERSIDLQAYHLHPDDTGRLVLRELRNAARRGVRVRLLVDDLYLPAVDDLLTDLASHANV